MRISDWSSDVCSSDLVEFLRANTDRRIKITIPGPFTMTQQAQNDHYPSDEAAAMDYAAAVNEEIKALLAAGADIVQIDEPYMQARPDKAREYAGQAINRDTEGVRGREAARRVGNAWVRRCTRRW